MLRVLVGPVVRASSRSAAAAHPAAGWALRPAAIVVPQPLTASRPLATIAYAQCTQGKEMQAFGMINRAMRSEGTMFRLRDGQVYLNKSKAKKRRKKSLQTRAVNREVRRLLRKIDSKREAGL